MNIVLPYYPRENDIELKYCLRSIEKYCKGGGYICIVGDYLPEWIDKLNVKHLASGGVFDKSTHEQNIYQKLYYVCKTVLPIGSDFALWNCDFFLTKEVDITDYPNYYANNLKEVVEGRLKYDGYALSVKNTIEALELNCKPILNFDIHCPMIFNSAKFIEVMDKYDWAGKRMGFVIKSLYANTLRLPVAYMPDCKIGEKLTTESIEKQIGDRHIFSIHPAGLTKAMIEYLDKLYPEKSVFEK